MVSHAMAAPPRAEESGRGESFQYRAVRRDGSVEQGMLHARHGDDAAALLAGRGLFPIDLQVAENAAINTGRRRRLSGSDLALGLRTLATLLEAGLPLGRSLGAFSDVAPRAWAESIPVLTQAVREG